MRTWVGMDDLQKRIWGWRGPIWVDHETGIEVIGSRSGIKRNGAVEGWAEFEGHPPIGRWV